MIFKNQTIGGMEDVTVVQFGAGDIEMTCFTHNAGRGGSGISFKTVEPHEIGSVEDAPDGRTLAEVQPEVYLDFGAIESIDALIERLHLAKTIFQKAKAEAEAPTE